MYDDFPTTYMPSLVMEAFLRKRWQYSPMAVLAETVPEKRMKALLPTLQVMYDLQLKLLAAFRDIKFCYETGSNVHTYTYLASRYGGIAKAYKEFAIELKKHRKQPEIAEYYEPEPFNFDLNWYDWMKTELECVRGVFKQRMDYDKSRFVWDQWDDWDVDWDAVNAAYKGALKCE